MFLKFIIAAMVGVLIIGGGFYFLRLNNKSVREDCLKQNGIWGRQGLSREESCNLPSIDADKICTSSNQCEGKCIGENINAITGRCSDYQKVFGCYPFVENGQVSGILCID